MADNRPWAKIDTGYIMNPKWFQVERIIADGMALAKGKTDGTCHQLAISNAVRCARDAHLASILYCAQNQTDGLFPVRAIKALVSVQTDEEEAAITALFAVGLWINHPGGMAEVRDYLEHQTPASLTKKRSEAGKKGAARRWGIDGKSHKSANGKTMASANAEEKRREEKIYSATASHDSEKGAPHPSPDSDPDFLAFWAHYPRKEDRLKAFKAWKSALKVTDAETLTKAAQAYAVEVQGREKRYIKLGSSWLNAGSWENEPPTPVLSSDPPRERDPYAWMDRRERA